jgi:HSP20 family protein
MFELLTRPRRKSFAKPGPRPGGSLDPFTIPWPFGEWDEGWLPAVDVSESDREYTVTAELPGLEAKEIQVSVEGDILTIRGEKRRRQEERTRSFHRVERSYGVFSRSLQLPGNADGEKVRAEYKDGVLTLTIPKAKGSPQHRIEVNEG